MCNFLLLQIKLIETHIHYFFCFEFLYFTQVSNRFYIYQENVNFQESFSVFNFLQNLNPRRKHIYVVLNKLSKYLFFLFAYPLKTFSNTHVTFLISISKYDWNLWRPIFVSINKSGMVGTLDYKFYGYPKLYNHMMFHFDFDLWVL